MAEPETKTQNKVESEVRNRKSSNSYESVEKAKLALNAMKNELAKNVNNSPYVQNTLAVIEKCKPGIIMIQQFVIKMLPYLVQFYYFLLESWVKIQPYHPEEFAPVILGLIMCFFGGHYFALFAAVEAYRVCGFDHTVKCLGLIYNDFQRVLKASSEDDTEDLDNNGIADVLEIPVNELIMRKFLLFLRTADPMVLSDAFSSILMGFMGVVITLRIKFAQTITFGNSLGNTMTRMVEPILTKPLQIVIPEEYHRWIPFIILYTCKTIGVSIAWTIQRVISAFYSAIRGAEMLTSGLLQYVVRMGYMNNEVITEGSTTFTTICFLLSALGFYWQVSGFFTLSFPLNVLLFPFTLAEWILMYFVGYTH